METSKYLKRFEAMAEKAADAYKLIGNCLLVEFIPDEEITTDSGLVIPETDQYKETLNDSKPIFIRVVAVGTGYYNEDGGDVPLDTKPGDIGLVSKVSVQWFSKFGEMRGYVSPLGITTEDELKLRFRGQAGYDQVFQALNEDL